MISKLTRAQIEYLKKQCATFLWMHRYSCSPYYYTRAVECVDKARIIYNKDLQNQTEVIDMFQYVKKEAA